jgi:hypothetical protein
LLGTSSEYFTCILHCLVIFKKKNEQEEKKERRKEIKMNRMRNLQKCKK